MIERFAWLEPWLARGAQPNADGYEWLQQHVTTIVNLRERDLERDVARHAPALRYVHIPVKNDEAPAKERALEWLHLCKQNAPDRPVFVHCKGGEGRTSTFCILARLQQGWTLKDAIAEQLPFGFDPGGTHEKQAAFLRAFASQR